MDKDLVNLSLQAAMPNNIILFDDRDHPSVMVRIPKFRICDVIEGGPAAVHPAFIVNGKEVPEIMISKYSNILVEGCACSLPDQSPDSEVTFDDAKAACENKGKGWHMMTNAEWAAVALLCKKNGFMPRGNNACGRDFYRSDETGRVTYTYERNGELRNGKTATGSGPVSWAHDNSPAGIYDMNGNVWTPVTGFRLVDGEIQITPNNDSASQREEVWRAVLPDGSLVLPGTEGTLKFDHRGEELVLTDTLKEQKDGWGGSLFGKLRAETKVPEILKSLAIFPSDPEGYGEQKVWVNNTGEKIPWRGGTWDAFANSGVFCLFTCYPRKHVSVWCGFRAAYVPQE